MANQASSKFKINKKQARRVYEILRLKNTNTSDKTAYTSYRLDVKNRLNAPFQVWFVIILSSVRLLLLSILSVHISNIDCNQSVIRC